MALIFVGFASFLAMFVALLIPVLAREIQHFAGALPGYVADLQERDDWIGEIARRADISANLQRFIANIPQYVGRSFDTVIGVAGTVLGRIFDLFTIGILSIYFMLSLPRLPHMVASFTRPARRAGSTPCSSARSRRSVDTSPGTSSRRRSAAC